MTRSKDKFSVPMLIGCLVAAFCVGIVYLWSVFKASTIAYYQWEDGLVNLISGVMLFGFCLGHTVGGNLQDRTNPRVISLIGMVLFGGGLFLSSLIPQGGSIIWFYLTYCVMGGLGSGFVFSSALSGLQKWMPHRRGLATGMVAACQGLGTALAPLIHFLLNRFDLPGAMRALAGILFVFGFAACLLMSLPSESYLRTLPPPPAVIAKGSYAKGDLSPTRAMRTLPFWLMFGCLFLYNSTWNILTPLITGLGQDRGLTLVAVTTLVTVTGLAQACGRLFMSALSDKIGRFSTLVIVSVITAVSALLLTAAGGGLYVAVVLAAAFSFGGPAAVNPAFVTDLFGPKYSGGNYGIIILGLGFSSVIFTAISNHLYAATGTYVYSFLLAAAATVINLLFLIKINFILKKAHAAEAE